MRITLLAPTPMDISAFGVRALAAYLKSHGYQVRTILIPGGVAGLKYRTGYVYQYEPRLLEQVEELCRGSDLIGISLMTHYFDRARQLTQHLKKSLQVPIIWGGIHPTVRPEESLAYADLVMVGEGEEAFLELAEKLAAGQDIRHIQNIWLKNGKEIIRNPLRPLIQDLDQLPFFDFGLEEHYLYCNREKALKPLDKELLKQNLPQEPAPQGTFSDAFRRTICYKVMTSRGCPHRCAYCAERTLALMYRGERYLRFRSAEHVMAELQWVRKEMPYVESIYLFDDTFLARPLKDIQHFCRLYKQEIGLPFAVQASPTTTSPEKMEALVNAGLNFVEMGIQSVSQRGMAVYRREIKAERILAVAQIFSRYYPRIYPPCYHVILDNPWETSTDVAETLDLLLRLPRPFWLRLSSLILFPGTEVFERAVREGLIRNQEDERRFIYSKDFNTPEGSYLNFLVYLAGFSYFPRWLVRGLAHPVMIKALEVPRLQGVFQTLQRLGDNLVVFFKGLRALLSGDLQRIRNYLAKAG
jgi:anaerobic magnesium-protoporphyrin IX monomethyl ester cyclase